jgi:hypothetical protein
MKVEKRAISNTVPTPDNPTNRITLRESKFIGADRSGPSPDQKTAFENIQSRYLF